MTDKFVLPTTNYHAQQENIRHENGQNKRNNNHSNNNFSLKDSSDRQGANLIRDFYNMKQSINPEEYKEDYRIPPPLVMLCYQNFAGVRQAKLIAGDKFKLDDEDAHTKFSTYGLFLPASKDQAVQGIKFTNAPKQLKLKVDQSSIRRSPFHKDQYVGFTRLFTPDEEPFIGCPRNTLYKALNALKDMGYELKIGIEIEFFLLNSLTLKPVEANPESSLTSLVTMIDDFDDIYKAFYQNNIEFEIGHKECGAGQYEIVLKYGEVMQTLDNYYLAKEIISQHFRKKGLVVTYVPKPFEDQSGTGSHVHISMWKDGKNCFGSQNGRWTLSDVGEHFMAGILKYFQALVHFMTPSPNSVRRLQAQSYVGCYNMWGIENKEAPIRLITALKAGGSTQQFEIKSFDHTANFYFAMACTIVYGMQGIREKLRLPEPVNQDAHFLSEQQRAELGIQFLPNRFDQRKEIIESEKGQPLRDFFGEELIRNVLLVHQQDFLNFAGHSHEDEFKHLLERY